MPAPDPSFEPAVRDHKKNRNTAIVLVVTMLLGGGLVLNAYENWSRSQATDDRPAVVYRITKERDLRILRQDGQIANLFDLRGKVIALNAYSLQDPEIARRSLEVMKRLAESRASTADLHLVSLIIDPIPSDKLFSTLATTASTEGMKLPQWWLGSNEPKTLHKFIKNELKVTTYPNDKLGKWDYDASIILIDKNGHIRRAVIPQQRGGEPFIATFDFEKAAAWDAKGAKTGTARSNTEELEVLINQTIDKLLAEPFPNP